MFFLAQICDGVVDLADEYYYQTCGEGGNTDRVQLIDEFYCGEAWVGRAAGEVGRLLWLDVALAACAIVVLGFGPWNKGKEGGEVEVRTHSPWTIVLRGDKHGFLSSICRERGTQKNGATLPRSPEERRRRRERT